MLSRLKLAKASVGGIILSLLMDTFLLIPPPNTTAAATAAAAAAARHLVGHHNIPRQRRRDLGGLNDTPEISLIIPENSHPGAIVGVLNQHIPFLRATKGLRYQIFNLGPSQDSEAPSFRQSMNETDYLFTIEPQTSVIRVSEGARLDRETQCPFASAAEKDCSLNYGVSVSLVDKSAPALKPQYSWLRVKITILDENDNEPGFNFDALRGCETIQLSEDATIGTKVRLPDAIDKDSLKNGQPIYRLSCQDSPINHPFSIYQKRTIVSDEPGQIWLQIRYALDYEKRHFYNCSLTACDNGIPVLCSTLPLCIALHDVNDNAPVFLHENVSLILREDISVGSRLTTVNATDADSGYFGEIRYSLVSDIQDNQRSLSRHFRLDPFTGALFLTGGLVGGTKFYFWIEARDGGEPESRMSRIAVSIYVVDVNNHAPEITILPAASKVRYKAGTSTTKSVLSRITKVPCNFGGLQDASTCQTREREVVERSSLVQIFEENVAPTNVALVRVSDADVGSNALVNCKLLGSKAAYSSHIQLVSEHQMSSRKMMYKLVLDTMLDCESHTHSKGMSICNSGWTIPVKIACQDSGNPVRMSYHNIFVEVLDMNEFPPVFEKEVYKAMLKENARVGSNVVQVVLSDADAVTADSAASASSHNPREKKPVYADNTLRFELDAPETVPFAIDHLSGRVYTTGELDAESITQYKFRINAINKGLDNVTLIGTCSIFVEVQNINDNPPIFLIPRMLVGSVLASRFNESLEGVFGDGGGALVRIPENLHKSTVFMELVTHDPDGGESDGGGVENTTIRLKGCRRRETPANGRGSMGIVEASDGAVDVFDVDMHSGKCWTTGRLDRETESAFVCIVTAEDGGPRDGGRLTSTATITIELEDENDNAPVWLYPRAPDDSRIQLGVEFPPDRIITRVRAVDADAGDNARVVYSIEEVSFVHRAHEPPSPGNGATGNNCGGLKRLFSLGKISGHLQMHADVRKCMQPGDSVRLLLKATDGAVESPLAKEAEFYLEFQAGSEVLNQQPQLTFLTQADEAFGSSQPTLLLDGASSAKDIQRPSNAAQLDAGALGGDEKGADSKRISVFVLMIAVPLCAILLCCFLVTTLLLVLRSRRRRRARRPLANRTKPQWIGPEAPNAEIAASDTMSQGRYSFSSPNCPSPAPVFCAVQHTSQHSIDSHVRGGNGAEDRSIEGCSVSLATGEIVFPVYLKHIPVSAGTASATGGDPDVTSVHGDGLVCLKSIPEMEGTFLVPVISQTDVLPFSSDALMYQNSHNDSGIMMACLVPEMENPT